MWNYNIKNNYEYSVLKLQKWWRKKQFIKMIDRAVSLGNRLPLQSEIDKIQLELKILNESRAIVN